MLHNSLYKWFYLRKQQKESSSSDSRMTKLGGSAGPRKKVGGQHQCLSYMVIFRCNEYSFLINMINPIKPKIDLWISSEPSPESLQIVKNFAGWKLSAVYVYQTNLYVKLSTKLGSQAEGQPEIWGHGPPRPSLRTATGVKYNFSGNRGAAWSSL